MTGDKETDTAAVDEAKTRREAPAEEASGGNGETPGEAAAAAADVDPEALRAQLDEARRTAESHWDAVLRTRAELENLRKRTERELENAHKYGLERFLTELLPVKDSLELGLAADAGTEKLREGTELTLKKFSQALEKFGVTELNPEGEEFNPEFHEAMTVQESEGQASNTVLTVIQKGYLLNGRLVRPALVIVAK